REERRREEPGAQAPARAQAPLAPLRGQAEPGEDGEREVEREREGAGDGQPSPRGEEEAQEERRSRGARRRVREREGKRDEGEGGGRRVRSVAEHEARHAGEAARGRRYLPVPGLRDGEGGGDELGGGDEDRGGDRDERRRRACRRPTEVAGGEPEGEQEDTGARGLRRPRDEEAG